MNIKNLYIIGGGLMGGGIAQVGITHGFEVTLIDISMEVLERSKAVIKKNFQKEIDRGRMAAEVAEEALKHLNLSTDITSAKDADLVIESVSEKKELKKSIFAQLSEVCREDILLATNTSAISIAEIASVVKNPDRVIGMHFVSPVPKMHLMEIVRSIATSNETVAAARQAGEALGKQCIISKDSPAFLINRMLDPMVNEAIQLVENGIGSIEDVDAAMRVGLNHPMGPLELMDAAGLDVLLDAINAIHQETNDPKYKPALLLRNMIRIGWLGRKSGKGFYIYHEDGTKTPNPDINNLL